MSLVCEPIATERRSLTTRQKLEVLIRYSRCPRCGEKFTSLDEVDWDHIGQLALTGDNSLENFRPLHRGDCHKAKSAEDARDRGKTRRAAKKAVAFNSRMLIKEPGKPREKSSRWAQGRKLSGKKLSRRRA